MAKRPTKDSEKPAPRKSSRAPAEEPKRKAPREVELKPAAASPGLRTPAPVALDAVLGQDRAISILRAAIDSKRLHHAWIFHGPPGVGKMTAALAFAAILLDPTSEPDLSGRVAPDPDSPAQALLRAGTHPDLHVITKELASISRDPQIRDSKQRTIAKAVLEEFLIEPSTRTGSGGGARAHKVFVIDEAELIDARGQNALLKTLEEPAPGRVIILITSREEHLLPTIRSRAQRVAFAPLDDRAMKAWLASAHLDTSSLAKPALEWLGRFAEGSPGTMALALSTGIAAWHETLSPMLAGLDGVGKGAQAKFPLDLAPTMTKLAEDWAQRWVDANEGASKDAANKAGAKHMIRLLADHMRHALRASGSPAESERAAERLDAIAHAERTIDANVPISFVLESLVARLSEPASAGLH